ncbi:hypothetical protein Ancab_035161 [Ancistrocladus abbreviatus]
MDFSPFKQDIDELIQEFDEGEFKMLGEMKRLWLSRKFSYIFDALPFANLPVFMQSMFTHCLSHMVTTSSLPHRLGGLYCLYCLYETQPFKPPFKIYLSLGELRRLKTLVTDAKEKGIKVVTAIVRRMLEGNSFLFGFLDINDYSGIERVKEMIDLQNARVQKMNEKLFANSKIEHYLHMDMGTELELEALKKISKEYADAKGFAIQEASGTVDVDNIKHIAESRISIAEEVEMITSEWNNQKETFYEQTGSIPPPAEEPIQEQNDFQQTELLQLPAPEQHQDGEDLQKTGFMQLLTAGEDDEQPAGIDQEDGLDYIEELEKQLSEA